MSTVATLTYTPSPGKDKIRLSSTGEEHDKRHRSVMPGLRILSCFPSFPALRVIFLKPQYFVTTSVLNRLHLYDCSPASGGTTRSALGTF